MSVLEIDTGQRVEAKDRRRPNRPAHVSPELIPLLRGEASVAEDPVQFGDPDQLRAARGLAVALTASAAFWAAIVYGARWILS